MTTESFIARRYLRPQGTTAFIGLISVIAAVGVFVGTAALTVVLAVMNGFQAEVETRITGTNAHVVLLPADDRAWSDYAGTLARVRATPGVTGAAPFVYTKALIQCGEIADGLVVKGVDLAQERAVTSLASSLQPPLRAIPDTTPGGLPGIVLGRELADRLRARPGSVVNLYSPRNAARTSLGYAPKARSFRVVALFSSGLYEYDSSLGYLSLRAAQDFFDLPGAVTGLEVRIADLYRAREAGRELAGAVPSEHLRANNWIDLNRNLFVWMRKEKLIMSIILGLIVGVAAVNIVSGLLMVVLEKKRDIGVLKTLGAPPAQVRRIFLLQGLWIGGAGTLAGMGTGLTLCFLQLRFHLVRLPGDVYFLESLPVRVMPLDVLVTAAGAVAVSLLAAWYPAWWASGLKPQDAIRYQ
ncbi:MAG: ABC transporter permease [Candidatus Eisenbacteria bacterium]|nr:ABC transporter permease [Candidatus Eisenbacteria bacterium]